MTVTHPGQRVGVLADAQNLYHSARSLYTRNIDYSALLEEAVDDRDLTRAIAYVIRADADDEETFFEALVDIGFETRIKDIKTFGDGSKKADWDVGMSLDAVSLAPHVDTVVLCTGDGDFARLCRYLRHEGVRVETMGFAESTAEELIEAADDFRDLSEESDRFLL
ncbi:MULTISPECIES: NYN domain-containing protein [Halomicrobium]|uniref:LabA-like NYN domain-containing protein n=1 Tax=Halomicrobium TaxID=203135 RepID=UPI001CD9EC75|nr:MULTISPECIES: NYN domain-containing protein [Halomicrobium]